MRMFGGTEQRPEWTGRKTTTTTSKGERRISLEPTNVELLVVRTCAMCMSVSRYLPLGSGLPIGMRLPYMRFTEHKLRYLFRPRS